MNIDYRKRRRIVWLVYLAASFFLFLTANNYPGAPDFIIMAGILPILSFFPVLVYTGILTHRARRADEERLQKEMRNKNVTQAQVERFLTDKTVKGSENGWAEDVLIWIFGVPMIPLLAFSVIKGERTASTIIGALFSAVPVLYCAFYLLLNRKRQRKLAKQYALIFAASPRGDYTYSELASKVRRQNAGYEAARLVKRNYMMNIKVDQANRNLQIIGYRKAPKRAYVCSNCGAASSITVGEAKICRYCGRPLM